MRQADKHTLLAVFEVACDGENEDEPDHDARGLRFPGQGAAALGHTGV